MPMFIQEPTSIRDLRVLMFIIESELSSELYTELYVENLLISNSPARNLITQEMLWITIKAIGIFIVVFQTVL